jgi:hypothetical protein
MKYILAMDYDEEGFDADGIGDYWYTDTNYKDMDSEEEALSYLQKNIRHEDGRKTNCKTIKEYCDKFAGIRFYERKY